MLKNVIGSGDRELKNVHEYLVKIIKLGNVINQTFKQVLVNHKIPLTSNHAGK